MAAPKIADTFCTMVDLQPGEYRWCACGCCSKQPFADASGCRNGFTALTFVVKQSKRYKLCMCKHTKKPPYCDSAHNQL